FLALVLALGGFGRPLAADEPDPAGTRLGKVIEDFTVSDCSGKPIALRDFKDQKAVVIVFLSFDCPVSASYAPTLTGLHESYASRGVAFLGVSSNADETAADLAKHAKECKLPFAVARDEKLAAAEVLKARTTPEAFVLDHTRVLRYRGRIDDAYAKRL